MTVACLYNEFAVFNMGTPVRVLVSYFIGKLENMWFEQRPIRFVAQQYIGPIDGFAFS